MQDNGPGIPAQVAGRLFEPFVTSKPVGKGTGLGLALSREYVGSFGGKLELTPIAGPGVRFSIHLPASRLSRSSLEVPRPPETARVAASPPAS